MVLTFLNSWKNQKDTISWHECFKKWKFQSLWIRSHGDTATPMCPVLSVAAQQQSWAVDIEIIWPTREHLAAKPFRKCLLTTYCTMLTPLAEWWLYSFKVHMVRNRSPCCFSKIDLAVNNPIFLLYGEYSDVTSVGTHIWPKKGMTCTCLQSLTPRFLWLIESWKKQVLFFPYSQTCN
jgi:hypothetical protein